jgi:hypothetical protein
LKPHEKVILAAGVLALISYIFDPEVRRFVDSMIAYGFRNDIKEQKK